MRRSTALLSLLLVIPSCNEEEPPAPAPVGAAEAEIYNAGDGMALEDANVHPQAFTIGSPHTGCTASLVASNAVLTAAHCTAAPAEVGDPYVPDQGTYTVNVDFNASPAVRTQLQGLLPWTTTDAHVRPHPLHLHIGDASVDVAVLEMPSSVSRCAMKPLRVVGECGGQGDPDCPYPVWVGSTEGTIQAWTNLWVLFLGAGGTDHGCTTGAGTSVVQLLTTVHGAQQHWNYPHQPVWLFPGVGLEQPADHSHICYGDSGGPVITGRQTTFGTNVEPDQVLSLTADWQQPGAGQTTGIVGPVLSSADLRPWLVDNALDLDQDGIEAWQDNCDTDPNENQADADHDGIGDACDAAPGLDDCADADGDGVPNYMDPCTGHSNTDADGDGLCDDVDLLCPNDPTNDVDGDQICGQRDNCPSRTNPLQENCNEEAEIEAGLQPVGDVCDPVPCVRANQSSHESGNDYLVCIDTSYFDVEPIRVTQAGVGRFRGRWGHRFCPCDLADGTSEAVDECARQYGCSVGLVSFDPPGDSWVETVVGITGPETLDARFTHDFSEPAELRPGGEPATLATMHWDIIPDQASPQGWSIAGSHWFHVVSEAPCQGSSCASAGVTQATLDNVASHYWAGSVEAFCDVTSYPWLERDWLGWWMPPPPDCQICGALRVTPFAYIRPNDRTIMMWTPHGEVAIETHLTVAAANALRETPGVRWLAPSEPSALLGEGAVRLASLALNGSAVGPALAHGPDGMGLLGPFAAGSPEPRARFGAVLRATEDDLIVVGGVLDGGEVAGDIWRFSFTAGQWETLATDGALVPGAVLAATYDAYDKRLVVIDEPPGSSGQEARLWTAEPATGTISLIGSWPRRGFFDELALGHSHDGALVLLASHGHGVPLRVVRLRLVGAGVVIEGTRTTTGVPLAPPRTNHRGIHILVDRPASGPTAELVEWRDLNPPGSKTLGDFVE